MVDVQAHERLSKIAGKTAERVLREWVEQSQHLMARPLQPEMAPGPEHKVVQPDAAAKKSGIGGVIGRALGALFGLGQRKGPAVIGGPDSVHAYWICPEEYCHYIAPPVTI